MRRAIKIELSIVERSKFEHNVRSRKTPVRLGERSKIVLLANVQPPLFGPVSKLV